MKQAHRDAIAALLAIEENGYVNEVWAGGAYPPLLCVVLPADARMQGGTARSAFGALVSPSWCRTTCKKLGYDTDKGFV